MKDNFTKQADTYAKYRPSYPPELFEFIMSHVSERKTAWDCATGNGQAAQGLADYFETVYATDISEKQLQHAYEASNIFYSVQPAEKTDFPSHSFDLITVSQALHWFNFEKFYAEVRRVAKPKSWLAVWMYGLIRVSPEIDQIIGEKFYKQTLVSYWDAERKHVDENYATIPFPFEEIEAPGFQLDFEWTLEELMGYLNTWSAVQKFIEKNDYNPLDGFINDIQSLWMNGKMKIVFPVRLRMGKV